jgi:hypothetical protein
MPLPSKLRAIWRYRPRVLTVALLFAVAAVIGMANLTSDIEIVPGRGGLGVVYRRGVYGCPFMWHWHNVAGTMVTDVIVGWEYSRAGLAANVGCWIILLAVPGGVCEWLLRRYRPRLRWSLRTMLAAVALVAAFCAWFAAARNRADLQDPIIAELEQWDHYRCVAVERPGPEWLEFIVPDRFRRQIVGLDMPMYGHPLDEAYVVRLGQLPRLKYLNLDIERLTPATTSVLRSAQLRWLHIKVEQPSSEVLPVLGELTQLEGLYLDGTHFTTGSLPHLAGLTNLKRLSVRSSHVRDAFSGMPPLPQLEAIEFVFSNVSGRDLRRLSVLPRLKALDLKYASLGADVDLADLARLDSLEELTVGGDDISAAGLESLEAIKHLRAVHISRRNAFKGDDVRATLKLDGGDELLGGGDELTVLARGGRPSSGVADVAAIPSRNCHRRQCIRD